MEDSQKIRFRCHRCKKKIAVPLGSVGRKVKCPGCNIVTIVPDIPGAQAQQAQQAQPAAAPPPPAPAPQPQPQYEQPNNDLASLANAGYDEQPYEQAPQQYQKPAYQTYEQPVQQAYNAPVRARGSGAYQWVDYLRIALFVAAGLIVGLAIWSLIEFFTMRSDMLEMMEKMGGNASEASLPFKAWLMLFLTFFGLLLTAFICLAQAMCCPIFKRMAQKIDQF